MKNFAFFLAFVTLLATSPFEQSHGASITVDFDSGGSWNGGNFESNGFRFSPCSEAIITSSNPVYSVPDRPAWQGVGGSNYLAFQNGALTNSNYLGDENCAVHEARQSLLFIDNGGKPFSLDSLYGPLVDQTIRIISSKGGDTTIFKGLAPDDSLCSADGTGEPGLWCPQTFFLSGPEWQGIKWLKFYAPKDIYVGFDNVSFRAGVPEPGTLALLSFGLLGLAATGRRRLH